MILLANLFLHPGHPHVELDQHLCNKSIDLFDDILRDTPDNAFIAVRKIVKELAMKADDALKRARSGEEYNVDDFAFDLNTDQNNLWGWDFGALENPLTMPTGFLDLDEFERVF
jgi:hypothetical protein